MHILLNTHSSHSEYNADCDLAVVELTPRLFEEIQRRVERARQLGRQDGDLYELYFWDGTAAFYEYDLIEACEKALATSAADAEHVVGDWMADLEQNGHALLPTAVDLANYEPQRTECDQFVLRCSPSSHNPEFEVCWTTIPKHSDVYVTTSDLSLKALEAYARDLEAIPI